jgi:D-tyrosyl-tRNA(Tyr) deacylase
VRAVVQRIARGKCTVGGEVTGEVGCGLIVFLGVGRDDDGEDLDWLLDKLCKARIFEDADGRMNRSVEDTGGSVLLISQFTLFGTMKKGTRPSFNRAGPPALGAALYQEALKRLCMRLGADRVGQGRFAEHMDIEVTNDGPVTLIFDTKEKDF